MRLSIRRCSRALLLITACFLLAAGSLRGAPQDAQRAWQVQYQDGTFSLARGSALELSLSDDFLILRNGQDVLTQVAPLQVHSYSYRRPGPGPISLYFFQWATSCMTPQPLVLIFEILASFTYGMGAGRAHTIRFAWKEGGMERQVTLRLRPDDSDALSAEWTRIVMAGHAAAVP